MTVIPTPTRWPPDYPTERTATYIDVRPGREAVFLETAALWHEALSSLAQPAKYTLYELVSGGSLSSYLLMLPRARLEPESGATSFRGLLDRLSGGNRREVDNGLAASVTNDPERTAALPRRHEFPLTAGCGASATDLRRAFF